MERVTAAMLQMDDSSSIIGGDLRVLTVLYVRRYVRACRAAPPDQKQLATWLVRTRLDGQGWPDIELADFANALGPTGMDELARLVAERCAANDPDSWTAVGIKLLREQPAALSGDVHVHVAVLAENLSSARQYGGIVTVLRDAGRDADAERWARRGLAEDPASHWTEGLREQFVGLLRERARRRGRVRSPRGVQTAHTTPGCGIRPNAPASGPGFGNGRWSTCAHRARVKEFYMRELISVLIREDSLDEAWATAVAAPGRRVPGLAAAADT